jgi:hypothetical protein
MLDVDLAVLLVIPAGAPRAVSFKPGPRFVFRVRSLQALAIHVGKCAPQVTEDVILDAAFAPLNP